MSHDPVASIVITDGYCWMHIPHIRIYHCRFPEAPGVGQSLTDAASQLANQLTRDLDFVHGRKREAIERAVSDVRLFRQRNRSRPLAAVP